MGKFDDRGIVSRNKKRTSKNAPQFTGVLNFSQETITRMQEMLDSGEDAHVRFGMWRKDDNPEMMTIKLDKPFNGGRNAQRGGDRGFRDAAPRGRDNGAREERRVASRDEDKPAPGWEGNDDPWGDDIPFGKD